MVIVKWIHYIDKLFLVWYK